MPTLETTARDHRTEPAAQFPARFRLGGFEYTILQCEGTAALYAKARHGRVLSYEVAVFEPDTAPRALVAAGIQPADWGDGGMEYCQLLDAKKRFSRLLRVAARQRTQRTGRPSALSSLQAPRCSALRARPWASMVLAGQPYPRLLEVV